MKQTQELTIEEFIQNKEDFRELSRIGNVVVFYREEDRTTWIQQGKKMIGMAVETMYGYVSKLAN